jgi:hypothetical protein
MRLRKLICAIRGHQWQLSKFVRLGSTGPTYVCHRCRKVIEV